MSDIQNLKLLILITLCVFCLVFSLLVGDSGLDWNTFNVIGIHTDLLQKDILTQIRLPHTLNAFAIGGLLALSGYLMQCLLGNPLADPFTLGTSGGAATFTLIGLMSGLNGLALLGASFLGALANMTFLILLVGRLSQAVTSKLLLVGVVLAAGWGALLSLLLVIAPALQTKSILFWMFGDIDYQSYPVLALIILLSSCFFAAMIARDLEIMSQGVPLAKTLGVETERLQTQVLILSSFITATAVSLGGTIGFLGLIVPHCTRLILQRFSRITIPFIVLLGGALIVIADLLARIVIAPEQLPIGLITTLIGIPFFLYLAKG